MLGERFTLRHSKYHFDLLNLNKIAIQLYQRDGIEGNVDVMCVNKINQ